MLSIRSVRLPLFQLPVTEMRPRCDLLFRREAPGKTSQHATSYLTVKVIIVHGLAYGLNPPYAHRHPPKVSACAHTR